MDLVTPPIDQGDGKTTKDPCVRTAQRAHAILQTYCASCHAPPAKMGGFDFVLDDGRLVNAVSSTNVDEAGKPQRLVIPGNARASSLYQRVVQGQMPPVVAPPLPPNPAPTVSDDSELEQWIDYCLGAKPSPTSKPDGGDAGDAGGDGG
ncbi:MAG: Planctomycete cytochrome [Labilithrix sp.]|nr:Planctomycete cytochrome [Labilithrix sp.]